jgi:hypothetical protein
MLHLLALVFIGAAIWITILSIPLFLLGGMRWEDLRSLLVHYAYKSFTFEGDVIPGVRPSLGPRLVIRALSREDDARRALVTKAIAIADERRRPRSGKIRLSTRIAQGFGNVACPRAGPLVYLSPLGRSVSTAKCFRCSRARLVTRHSPGPVFGRG